MRLWIMRTGWFDARADAFVPSDQSGVRELSPVYSYLMETDDGRLLLFDTGCSQALAENPRSILGNEVSALEPRLTPSDHIAARLAELGFRTEDVSQVALSHLHFDHSGGNASFPRAQFWIQRREWEAAEAPGAHRHYPDPASRVDPSQVRLLDGDTPWASGVTLISTPGHTPGHQSLLVVLPNHRFLITSDAAYRASLFDPEHIGAAVDPEAARRSVARLNGFAREGYRPFFSHDPDQWREDWVRLSPAFYA
jgi:N-acyl homoserine lactone hydrolase